MSEHQILAVQKRPGKPAVLAPITNSLTAFQKAVGGYIEVVTVSQDLCIICNETGRIDGLPYNTNICGFDFYGPILAVGVEDDGFVSVPGRMTGFIRECMEAKGGCRHGDEQ